MKAVFKVTCYIFIPIKLKRWFSFSDLAYTYVVTQSTKHSLKLQWGELQTQPSESVSRGHVAHFSNR